MHRFRFVQLAVCVALAASILAPGIGPAQAALPLTSPGAIDPTFAGGSYVEMQIATHYDYGIRIAAQADGRYLVSGYGADAAGDFGVGYVARLLPDGTADASFNGTGRQVLGSPGSSVALYDAQQVAGGRIVAVGGEFQNATQVNLGIVVGMRADGTFDPAFANGGTARFEPQLADWIFLQDLAVQADGHIVAVGYERDAIVGNAFGLVVRLTADGHPDPTFGPGGRRTLPAAASAMHGKRVVIAPDGKILVAGVVPSGAKDHYFLAVVRLDAAGATDSTFGNGGVYIHAPAGVTDTTPGDMSLDSAGRIVVAGWTGSGQAAQAFVLRLTAVGTPDPTFGFQGVAPLAPMASAAGLVQQPDGRIVVSGSTWTSGESKAIVGRLLPNGHPDPSLGPGGMRQPKLGNASSAGAVLVDADAKIVTTGWSTNDGGIQHSFVARMLGTEITTPVVEFFNGPLNHYFITADANEAAAIDAGTAGPGWARTGQVFKSGGPNRVCRFYGSPETDSSTGQRRGPNSHFYTIEAGECATVKQDAGWKFESYDFNGWPVATGACPAGTAAIKRVYNNRFAQNDSNHRYATSDAVYQAMISAGWSGEGVVFCAPL